MSDWMASRIFVAAFILVGSLALFGPLHSLTTTLFACPLRRRRMSRPALGESTHAAEQRKKAADPADLADIPPIFGPRRCEEAD